MPSPLTTKKEKNLGRINPPVENPDLGKYTWQSHHQTGLDCDWGNLMKENLNREQKYFLKVFLSCLSEHQKQIFPCAEKDRKYTSHVLHNMYSKINNFCKLQLLS